MAEEVFQQWLGQRRPGTSNDVNAIRSSATRFAQARLDSAEEVRRVMQMALDHFRPDRTVRGRPALAGDEPVTPQKVAVLWLARGADVKPENVMRNARNFALRKGLNDIQASEVVRLVVEGLQQPNTPPPPPPPPPSTDPSPSTAPPPPPPPPRPPTHSSHLPDHTPPLPEVVTPVERVLSI